MNHDRLRESITRHEGYRDQPYRDHLGNWTVGWGHLIEHMQLSSLVNYGNLGNLLNWVSDRQTHEHWLETDILTAEGAARRFVGDAFDKLSDVRQEVLVEMAFQLGASRLAGFSKFRQAVMDRLWVRASSEMSDSLWARQTPKRAQELAERMIHG